MGFVIGYLLSGKTEVRGRKAEEQEFECRISKSETERLYFPSTEAYRYLCKVLLENFNGRYN